MMLNNPTSAFNAQIDIEGAILDAELLVKYRFVERAVATLERAVTTLPKNTTLREKLCEICLEHGLADKAVEHSIALSTIFADNGDLEKANQILMQARGLSGNQSITAKLEALKKSTAKQPLASPAATSLPAMPTAQANTKVLLGDLGTINLFDVIQIIENSRITGILRITTSVAIGCVYFNYGQIADAQVNELRSTVAFKCFVDVNNGTFEMEKSPVEFKQNIDAPNNTNLILDVLREIDEERHGMTR